MSRDGKKGKKAKMEDIMFELHMDKYEDEDEDEYCYRQDMDKQ